MMNAFYPTIAQLVPKRYHNADTIRASSRGVCALVASALMTIAIGGPSGSAPKVPARAPSQAQNSAEAANSIMGSGNIYAEQRDIKNVLLWKLSAAQARYDRPAAVGTLRVSGITAFLYDKGIKKAILTAPDAVGNDVTKQLEASGGAVVKSVAPPWTILTADTITWQATSKKIVATGHVIYTNKTTGVVVRCPRLVTDTTMSSVSSSDVDMDIPIRSTSRHK